jgi:hypothetical protein
MREALALAQAELGLTTPNPSVGCVIVRGDKVVGCGVTAGGGRPHAEARALAEAGALARGATAYVSFEPRISDRRRRAQTRWSMQRSSALWLDASIRILASAGAESQSSRPRKSR